MNRYDINGIEFSKILDSISSFCHFDKVGINIANISPTNNKDFINSELKITDEFASCINANGEPVFLNPEDISMEITKSKKGGLLTIQEILKVLGVVESVSSVKKYSSLMSKDLELYSIFNSLIEEDALRNSILKCINDEETINDDASVELSNIRKTIRKISQQINNELNSIIKSEKYDNYVQDKVITKRSGRYVIPIKADQKNNFKGIVHDVSASGSTFFMEPMKVVELNNLLNEYNKKELLEINKILYSLLLLIADSSETLLHDLNTLEKIDFEYCKAKYAIEIDATIPNISDHECIKLIRARNPLIENNSVVPIDVVLKKGQSILVITGPNTGGKTVALKTVGLLTIMLQCGILIPADKDSAIGIYNNICIDIEDGQSIEQSLSTFSSHIKNIASIIKDVDKNSLVLIDEICSGTDPIEGAALSISVTKKMLQLGCHVILTTHYAEMREYAISQSNIESACCEFDMKTLSPTYKLIIGESGVSHAFAIASKLGLDINIVNGAKEILDKQYIDMNETISNLAEKRKKTDDLLNDNIRLNNELKIKVNNAKKEADSIIQKANRRLKSATDESESLINKTKSTSRYILNELRILKSKSDSNNFGYQYDSIKKDIDVRYSKIDNRIRNIDTPKNTKVTTNYNKICVGNKVRLNNIDNIGTVIEVNEKNATVKFGNLKTKTKLEDLILIPEENDDKKKYKIKSNSSYSVNNEFDYKYDVRGKFLEDSIRDIDIYLDKAVFLGIKEVQIIHGNGTGSLRSGIREYFKNDKRVDSIRSGNYNEGGTGVSIFSLHV